MNASERNDRRNASVAWLTMVMLLAVSLLGAYVVAYYLRGMYYDLDNFGTRVYASEWEAAFFTPAGKVETLVTGYRVEVGHWERSDAP